MTAINLGLRGLFGFAVWQISLTLELHRVYKIGTNLAGGVNRELAVEYSPFNYNTTKPGESPSKNIDVPAETDRPVASRQLDLF